MLRATPRQHHSLHPTLTLSTLQQHCQLYSLCHTLCQHCQLLPMLYSHSGVPRYIPHGSRKEGTGTLRLRGYWGDRGDTLPGTPLYVKTANAILLTLPLRNTNNTTPTLPICPQYQCTRHDVTNTMHHTTQISFFKHNCF